VDVAEVELAASLVVELEGDLPRLPPRASAVVEDLPLMLGDRGV
jgi:hypothetical protein